MQNLLRDIRYALRNLRRSPTFTTVALLSLALGIGTNTAVFSLMRQALLTTLPVANPEEFVEITCDDNDSILGASDAVLCPDSSYPGFENYRDNNRTLSGTFAFNDAETDVNAVLDGTGELARMQGVSGEMYELLGLTPAIGRLLIPSDDQLDAAPVVVLSHAYWQRRFGGDPTTIGRILQVNERVFTIVGVTPPGFDGVRFGFTPDITLPLGVFVQIRGEGHSAEYPLAVRTVGRRRTGVTLEELRADFEPLFQENLGRFRESVLSAPIVEQFGESLSRSSVAIRPVGNGLSSGFRESLDRPLRILMALTAFVLLIACANLAGAMAARARSRSHEFSIRVALGGGRTRLVRQVLTETLLLTLGGGLLGLALTAWTGDIILRFAAGETGLRSLDLTPNWPVLAFALGVAVLTGLLAGTAPAYRAAATDPQNWLRDSSPRIARSRLHAVLVGGQVALTVVLLVGSGLFLRTFQSFRSVELGFEPRDMVVFELPMVMIGYDQVRTSAVLDQAIARLKSLPAVRNAAASSSPIGDIQYGILAVAPGFETATIEELMLFREVGPGFFETVGLDLVLGRGIEESDRPSSRSVAVVNESFARHFFGRIGVIGETFAAFERPDEPFEIVGVVRDARELGPKEPVESAAYMALAQNMSGVPTISVRTEQDGTAAVMAGIRQVIREIDPSVPIRDMRTTVAQLDDALRRERLLAYLASLLGFLTLTLVAIGLYGAVGSSVIQRTRELGIRFALGALPRNLAALVMRETTVAVLGGLAIGLLASMALSSLVRSQLFGIEPLDPASFLLAGGALLTAAAFAVAAPLLRVVRLDPVRALRHE